MRYPLHVTTDMMKWQAKNKLQGRKRYPVVLMLEPLYTCNLACVGCTPERHSGDLKDRLPFPNVFRPSMSLVLPLFLSVVVNQRFIRSFRSW